LKLLEENKGKNLEDTGIDRTPIAQEIRTRIDIWDCITLKSFCTAEETVNRIKRELIEGEKIFTNYSLDQGLVSRIYKQLQKLNIKKPNNPINKWAKEQIVLRRSINGQ
jgi:hypothetical protein